MKIVFVCGVRGGQIGMPGLSGSREALGGGMKNTQNSHFGPHGELLDNIKAVRQHADVCRDIICMWVVRQEQIDILGRSGSREVLGGGMKNTQNRHFGPHGELLDNTKAVRQRADVWCDIICMWDVRREQIDIPGRSGSREVLGGGIKNTQNSHFGPHGELLVNVKAVRQRADVWRDIIDVWVM